MCSSKLCFCCISERRKPSINLGQQGQVLILTAHPTLPKKRLCCWSHVRFSQVLQCASSTWSFVSRSLLFIVRQGTQGICRSVNINPFSTAAIALFWLLGSKCSVLNESGMRKHNPYRSLLTTAQFTLPQSPTSTWMRSFNEICSGCYVLDASRANPMMHLSLVMDQTTRSHQVNGGPQAETRNM